MGESKTMKRIRVLHSELNGELGGIESFLYNVYRFIDKEKVEFDFLTISDTPAYGDKFKKMGSTVYKVPKHINFLGYYFAIDKILREGNYDIVHIHKNSAIDILILKVLQRFPNIKVVVHSHNTFPSVGGKLEKLHKFNRKYLYDNADYRLACSDNAGKWMYGNGAFEIIKNGIDTKGFRFCTEYGEEIRAMYGIPMNAFVIGHVGRFTNQKNHSKLIDIFAAIKERKSDAYLLLLGGGELQDTIKSKVEKLNLCDSVIFCGVRTDVNKYLCAMDAFVFPSTWEGLGIVAIEAQASGLECYLSRELPKEVEVTDIRFLKEISEKVTIRDEAVDAIEAYCVGLHNAEAVDEYGAFLKKCGELTQLLADNKRIAVICCQNYGRLMHLRLYKNVNAEIQEEWNAIVEILKQCNYDEDVYKNVLDAVEEYFRTLVQRKKEDKLFELERFMAQVYEENGRCEAAEVAALCLANLYNGGGHRKITPDEYETIKKYLQKFPESMHIRAAFIIASEAIYSPSAEYKRVPDKIINKAKQWSEQYPKKIEFQEAYFGLLFSRLKYAQAQDMRNEQRRVYREMKTVAERANYSEYNESNQLMESVDILHRVFGY